MTTSWHCAISCDRCHKFVVAQVSPIDPTVGMPATPGWHVMPGPPGTRTYVDICAGCWTDDDAAAELALELDDWGRAGPKSSQIMTARMMRPDLLRPGTKPADHGGGS